MTLSTQAHAVQPDATLEKILGLARRVLGLSWVWLSGPAGEVLAGARPLEPEGCLIHQLEHPEWGKLGQLGLSNHPLPVSNVLEGEIHDICVLLIDLLAQHQQTLWSTSTLENSPQPVFAVDLEGRLKRFNPAALRLFRLSAEEVQGQLFERIPALSSPLLDVAFSKAAGGEDVRPLELPCFRSDGSVVLLRFSLAPLYSPRGRIRGVVFCADDLLASLENSNEREALRRLYAEVLDYLPLELILLDGEERVLYLNPTVVPDARMRRSFQGVPWEQVSRAMGRKEEVIEGWRNGLNLVRHSGVRIQGEETVDEPGEKRHFLRSLQPVVSMQGNVEMFIGYSLDITEQRRAQLEREEALQQFQQLFENATEGIYRVDPQQRLLWANPALVRLNGCTSADELRELMGENPGSWYVKPGRWDEFMALLEHSGHLEGFESEVQLPVSAEHRWIVESARRVLDPSSGEFYIEGTIQDITARKRAEAQLLSEKILLEGVIQTSPSPIFLRSAAGEMVLVNPALLAVSHQTPEEFFARTGPTHPNNPAEFAQWFENDRIMLERGEVTTFEEQFTLLSGEVRTYNTVKAPLRREGGEVLILGISNDITELKRNTERLVMIERAVESSSDSISIISPQGTVIYQNAAAQRNFGYTLEQLQQGFAGANALVPTEILPRVRSAFERGEPFQGEITVLNARGEGVPVLVRLDLMKDEAGQEIGTVAVVIDITERKRIEGLKDAFVATVSHELRTPLTSIKGALGLLAAGVLGEISSEQRPMLDIAHHNAERLISLVGDLLDMQKIEGEALSLTLERLELQSVLERVVTELYPYAENLEVQLVLEGGAANATDKWWVNGDSGRLTQVLSNLISNACKFSSAGQSVWVRLLEHSSNLRSSVMRVEVEDRGAGIPEAFRGQIFQKFAQADASSTRAKGGTGLGLAISKAIVERHGGSIGFESLEVGTLFYFELPLLEG